MFNHPGLTKVENALLHKQYKELLQFSMNNNNSNEVAFVLSRNFRDKTIDIGNGNEVVFSQKSLNKMMTEKNVYVLHNHPKGFSFSMDDLDTFRKFANVKTIALIANSGHIELLQKTDKYDTLRFAEVSRETIAKQKVGTSKQVIAKEVIERLAREGLIVWKK